MSGDPNSERGMSLTLKQDGTNTNPGTWAVFHGTMPVVREQILDYFGWTESEEFASLNMHELTIEATRAFKAAGNASALLGGSPAGARSAGGGAWSKGGGSSQSAPPAAEPEPVDPKVAMLDTIGQLPDLEKHRDFWAKNSAALKADEDLLNAWKERGGALKAAAGT